MKTEDRRYVCSPHAVSRLVGDTMVLFDLRTDKYFGLPNVGARVWALLSEGATLSRIADVIAAEYEVTVEQAREDAERLAGELADAGLVLRSASVRPIGESHDPQAPNSQAGV
jgi:hypothetical protein